MVDQAVFLSARALNEMVYKYVHDASRELGLEKALALLSDVSVKLAVHQAQVVREAMGADHYDVRAAFKLCRTIIGLAYGMDLTVVAEATNRIVANSGRCPMFEACQLWGIDSRKMCRSGPTRFIDVTLKQLNPDMSYQILKYRSSADDFCQAAVVLGKPYSFPGVDSETLPPAR